jgi:LysM repeat protein
MKSRTLYLVSFLFLLFCIAISTRVQCESRYYTVRKGDTLYSIAKRFEVLLERLIETNRITNPTKVKVGTVLEIPSDSYIDGNKAYIYKVKKGDTLYGISKRFGITLSNLLRINELTAKSILKINQELIIPGVAATAWSATEAGVIAEAEDSSEAGTTATGGANPETENGTKQPSYGEEGAVASFRTHGVPFWPHPGEIQSLSGKLSSAVAILGRNGDSVVSVSSGRVTWAAPFRGFGKMVFVKAANGFVFGYGGHSTLRVKVGDLVRIGTEIGSLGANSHDGVAKVFFFVTKDGKPYEPSKAPRT